MKTTQDLFAIMGKAQMQNVVGEVVNRHWMFRYSGHVDKLDITLHPSGWKLDDPCVREMTIDMKSKDSIQAGYWFIKSNIK